MRVRSLRWLVVFGCAAIAFGAIGYSVAHAQVAEQLPDEAVSEAAERTRPPDWDGQGEHPGKALFDNNCRLCHFNSERMHTGPGLQGIAQRIAEGPAHQGMSVEERLLSFIRNARQGGPEVYSDDPYFRSVQEGVGGPGVQMSDRGGLPVEVTDREILNIIDYILRFRDIEFDKDQYWREYKLGRALVSGESPFEWGAPACASCHSVGPDIQGANIGQNVAHTYVLMRERGKDEKNNYTDGLYDILSGEDAPKAHHFYRDEVGRSPLTDAELKVVATFFEQAARETGTEHTSNYLPIFALLFAALCIIALEPGIVNILFAKEHGEYIDGPYKEEDHHGHEEDHEEENSQSPGGNAGESGEKTSESKEQEPGAQATGAVTDKEEATESTEQEPGAQATGAVADKEEAAEEKPATEPKSEDTGEGARATEEAKPESKDTEYSPKPESEDKPEDKPEDKKEDS